MEKSKEEIFKGTENNCSIFFEKKIEMFEKYDFILSPKESRYTYELSKDPKRLLPESYEPILKFFFMFRNSNVLLIKLINQCKTIEEKKSIARIIANFFFENIFSTNFCEDSLLVVIYLILEKEIAHLKIYELNKWQEDSFAFMLLNQFGFKEDTKGYLSLILNDIILELENKEDNVLYLDINKINEVNFGRKHSYQQNDSMHRETTFIDNLLENDSLCKSVLKLSKTIENKRLESINNFDPKFLTNISLEISDEETGPEINQIDSVFDFTKKDMINRITTEKNKYIKEFIIKQVTDIRDDETLYMNHKFIENLKQLEPYSRPVVAVYKNNYQKMKYYTEMLLNKLIEYQEVIPYSIKCICKIISMLLIKKIPKINKIELNAFISKFVFNQLIFPFFVDPDSNGILTSTILSNYTRKNILVLIKIFKQVIQGHLFQSTKDPCYTLFNSFIIEIIPSIHSFFESLIQVQLPQIIEKLFEEKDNQNRNINYNFLNENEDDEKIEHQSICLNWSEINLFYEIVNNHQKLFNDKENSLLMKHFSKIEYQIEYLREKEKEDEKNKMKTFLLFTKINMEKTIEEKIKFRTEEKITFENEDLMNSNYVLPRIKYCLRKILGRLQNLSKKKINPNLSVEQICQTLHKMLEIEEHSSSWFDSTIPLTWYGLYLKTHLSLVPPEYKSNNYEKLFEEMIYETEQSFKGCDNEVINQLLLKNKNSSKKNQVLTANLFKFKQIEKFISMQKFVDKVKTPICICYTENQKNKKTLVITKPQNCVHTQYGYLDNVLFEKKKNNNHHCSTIKEFINKFPNVQREQEFDDNGEDLFRFEENLKVHDAIHEYFKILYEYFKLDPLFTQYGSESDSIFYEVTSYIISKLYKKLYSDFPDKSDISFFQKCVSLDWIKPNQIVHDKQIIDEKLWETSMKYLEQMDRAKSPLNKINAFSQASKIIQSSISFCSGKNELGVDDSLNVFIYIVLKAKPKRIMSNIKFISMYLNKELQKKDKGLLLTQLNMVVQIISKMDYKDTGVSSDEWNE